MCEAWYKNLNHGDIDYDWDCFCLLRCQRIAALTFRASWFPMLVQLSTTVTLVPPVLLRSRPTQVV